MSISNARKTRINNNNFTMSVVPVATYINNNANLCLLIKFESYCSDRHHLISNADLCVRRIDLCLIITLIFSITLAVGI